VSALRTKRQVLAFVRRHGAVLLAARGPLPNLAEAIAGEPIRGSWWGHPQGNRIYLLCEELDDSGEALTFKLVGGKVTYVHRRLLPALVKLADRFDKARLAHVWSEHTPSGAHRSRREPYPGWVSPELKRQARALRASEAEALLAPLLEAQRGSGPRRTASANSARSR
jgi:hypothetical protein